MMYDIIILGAGCAGLSLANYLLDSSLHSKKILLIDKEDPNRKMKTWCYWAAEPLSIHPQSAPLISWGAMSIIQGDRKLSIPLKNLKYYRVRAEDFYHEIWEKIHKSNTITYVNDTVEAVIEEAEMIKVVTKHSGHFHSSQVFNSTSIGKKEPRTQINQVFLGWEVVSTEMNLDTKEMTLMHFDQKTAFGAGFTYILPLEPNRALVEYTVLSNGKIPSLRYMERKVRKYLHTQLSVREFSISYKENGVIPMSTLIGSNSDNQNLTHIGTAAGCTKPSTGYTFYTIQKHCKEIVRQLEENDKTSILPKRRKKRYSFYDNILLNIANKWPNELPGVFFNLFQKNSPPLILSFLNEETSFWDEVNLLIKLRFSIFLKSLFNYEQY